jgi:hypothetical protein
LDIDTAAQRVEEVAFRKDLLEADIRKTKETFGSIWQELDTVIKAVSGTKSEDNKRRQQQGLGRLRALRAQYSQAGDTKAVAFIDDLIGQLSASTTGYISASPIEEGDSASSGSGGLTTPTSPDVPISDSGYEDQGCGFDYAGLPIAAGTGPDGNPICADGSDWVDPTTK